jgi:hypothetical protein
VSGGRDQRVSHFEIEAKSKRDPNEYITGWPVGFAVLNAVQVRDIDVAALAQLLE